MRIKKEIQETIISINNVQIRLTNERWEHIIRRHPEMWRENEKVLETVSNPDIIQKGDRNELIAIKFYADTPLTSKYLVVMYKEISSTDGFVITAYFTSKPAGREILWRQK